MGQKHKKVLDIKAKLVVSLVVHAWNLRTQQGKTQVPGSQPVLPIWSPYCVVVKKNAKQSPYIFPNYERSRVLLSKTKQKHFIQ